MRKSHQFIACLLLALSFFIQPAAAGENEVWWASAKAEADREGYLLIDDQALNEHMAAGGGMIVIDARADYEFAAGHIPGSVNMEFDLGDRMELSADKRKAFKGLMGPDKARPVVIYCRSFRWLRSAIAARWAAQLGYTEVYRYAAGFHGWKAAFPQTVAGEEKKHVLAVGDTFPACRVAVLSGDADREYLGLPEGTRWLELSELSARFVLIQLYNNMCTDCVAETKMLSRFFKQVESDPVLADALKIIGLGVYNSNREVVKFKKHWVVAYPLFSDKDGQIFECLGQAELPLAYLVRAEGDGTWTIELIKRGYFEPDENFLRVLRAAVIRTEDVD